MPNSYGAGDGNRTRALTLGRSSSTIKPRLRAYLYYHKQDLIVIFSKEDRVLK